jgi:acyl CoA:acetate/3-ketoacid CoA transferase alpha subunit
MSTRRTDIAARLPAGNATQTLPLDGLVARIPDAASLMIGGFMGVGTPERLIDELVRQGKRDPPVIATDTAMVATRDAEGVLHVTFCSIRQRHSCFRKCFSALREEELNGHDTHTRHHRRYNASAASSK